MPTMSATAIEDIIRVIYENKGVSADEASVVARHQAGANLVGHDSHGAIRTRSYVDRIDRGDIVPGAPFAVERQTPSTAVIDGGWGFGFVQTERATQLAIDKARAHGVAAVTIRYQSHMGRLGHYIELVAAAGMIGILAADSGRGPKAVAPFGGREARLGTNPICIGVPTTGAPLILDMATSAAAGGKVQLMRNEGRSLPEGWLIDRNGRSSIDPNDYFNGGALLPFGGSEAHKGFGLSVVVEVLCGILTGLGFGIAENARHNDGNFLAVFDVERFRDIDEFTADMDAFIGYLKGTPLAEGFDEIYYPGEIESLTKQRRLAEGVPIDEPTWNELVAILTEQGIRMEDIAT